MSLKKILSSNLGDNCIDILSFTDVNCRFTVAGMRNKQIFAIHIFG